MKTLIGSYSSFYTVILIESWWCSGRRSWFERFAAQVRQKSATCILWFQIISRDLYIVLSNLLCLLSNSFSCSSTGLFSQWSYLFYLFSIAYCSKVKCLLPALSHHLSYVSPLMSSSAPQPCSSPSHGNGSGYGAFLRQRFTTNSSAVMTLQVLVTC